ncbi:PTS sugar transporter subunit IIA [Orrella sp. 11846]|uniref:PTS sugar transporter subunit IIA n=1 Tax=Orrella sp. 11846 TaxID=3409913 RepID=UPI003B58E996
MAAKRKSVALVIVAHVPLASALLEVAQHVLGTDAPVHAIDIEPGACAQDSTQSLLTRLETLNEGAGVLLMTDLPGASPSNICVSAAHVLNQTEPTCQVISGVNPAMVLRAINYRHQDLMTLADQSLQGGVRAIQSLNSLA